MQGQGHAARQGPEGGGEKEAQGDLRVHEGQGSVRRLKPEKQFRPARARVSTAENAWRKYKFLLAEL